tara:strand:+ start:9464 stop:11527 length:2064 start_codon:yes stop_codon:yes gene_type:complete
MDATNIFDQILSNAVLEFEKINSFTNITSDKIKREPSIEERETLWNLTRVFVDFIYKQDLNLTNKELRDKVCHYSIVALHWNDLQLDNKEFSYSNGRFRRDTVALALCLFSRLDNSYADYHNILNGWILPHTNFSVLLWSLRSIIDSNRDNFFSQTSNEDAKKSINYLTDSYRKNRYVDYEYLIDNDKEHPLLEHWWRIRLLFKYPNVDTWIFLRRYIWNSIDVPGGLGLLSSDRDINKDFLKTKSELIEFPKNWNFSEKLLFLFVFFCFKIDDELDEGEKEKMKKYWKEWNTDSDDEKYNKTFEAVISEMEKNSSIEKLYQCVHDIKAFIINKFNKDNTTSDLEKQNKLNSQLVLILTDLKWLSYADGFCHDNEFQFIEALKGIWGVQEKLFDGDFPENSGIRENFPEFQKKSDGSKLKEVSKIDKYPKDLYFQTKLDHWNCLVKDDAVIKGSGNNHLKVIPFPNLNDSANIEKDLFKRFSIDEIDLIVNKINSTKSCIYLTWINETLKPGVDNRGFKSPFWFMPFVCYGFDVGSFLIFEQNGIFTNYKDNNELTCVLHVDLWDSVSVEKGWNGLLDDWVKEGYIDQSDLQLDIENITSLKIEGTNPQTGKKIMVNFVDTHGPGKKSTLHIIKAIWDNVWKDTVAENKDSSVYILPRNNEYFNSWNELLDWASLKNDNTKGNNETP